MTTITPNYEEPTAGNPPVDVKQQARVERRNYFGGLWHGAFLAFGISLTQPATVIAAFIASLTGSTIWVGALVTVLTVAEALPQPFVARSIEPRPRKMPYLMLAIYLRVVSWGVLALLIFTIGANYPDLLAWTLVGLLSVFYAGGGLGNIPYTDIIGKIIPADRRGAFFGGRQILAAPLAVGAALLARHILAEIAYPDNYALLFGLAAVGLAVASLGFWLIREPVNKQQTKVLPWRLYAAQIKSTSRRLRTLMIVQWLTGFSLMVIPFYVVYAREELGAPPQAVGWFLLAQVLGGVTATFVWAHLVDHTGSRKMLFFCASISAITPVLAVFLSTFSWYAMLPVFFLAGATFNGRVVGFNSALLEMSPAAERPTYASVNTVLLLPIAFLPLLAGLLLGWCSYQTLFLSASIFIAIGAIWTHRLPPNSIKKPQHV